MQIIIVYCLQADSESYIRRRSSYNIEFGRTSKGGSASKVCGKDLIKSFRSTKTYNSVEFK